MTRWRFCLLAYGLRGWIFAVLNNRKGSLEELSLNHLTVGEGGRSLPNTSHLQSPLCVHQHNDPIRLGWPGGLSSAWFALFPAVTPRSFSPGNLHYSQTQSSSPAHTSLGHAALLGLLRALWLCMHWVTSGPSDNGHNSSLSS